MSHTAESSADASVAVAIDRVLQAERSAQAAVTACESECSNLIAAARQQARTILDRAQARSVAIHARAATNLDRCAAEIMEQRMKSVATAVMQLSDPGRLSAAIERLALRLTTQEAPTDVT